MIILDGKQVAAHRREILKGQILSFVAKSKRKPRLTVILVGENPASQVYVANKVKACQDVGMESELLKLPASVSELELLQKLEALNQDPHVDGILVQLPLPAGISEHKINLALSASKDADAFTPLSLGRLWAGLDTLAPCTPQGVMNMLSFYNIETKGRHAVVVGRSTIVGKPMSHLLTQADATVTVCHSKTPDLKKFTEQADIVVVAAGKPLLLGKEHFKKGSVVVDVGIHKVDGKLCGDVRFNELQDWCFAASPVPGGVGPMTIVTLLENTLSLAQKRQGSL